MVIAIVAVVVLADSSEDDTDPGQAAATATATATPVPTEASPAEDETPTPTATPTPTPTPKPPPPLLTADKVTELEFTEGDTIRFRVRSDDAGPHPRARLRHHARTSRPGETMTMSFKATITGIFEIEFEDAGTEIGELKVEPG